MFKKSPIIKVSAIAISLAASGCAAYVTRTSTVPIPAFGGNNSINSFYIYPATAMDIGCAASSFSEDGYLILLPFGLIDMAISVPVDTVFLPFDLWMVFANDEPSTFSIIKNEIEKHKEEKKRIEKDKEAMMEEFHRKYLLKKQATEGNPKAQYELYNELYSSGERTTCEGWLIKSAEQGYFPALHIIATEKLQSATVNKKEEEIEKMLSLTKSGADRGSGMLQGILGEYYASNQKSKDFNEAYARFFVSKRLTWLSATSSYSACDEIAPMVTSMEAANKRIIEIETLLPDKDAQKLETWGIAECLPPVPNYDSVELATRRQKAPTIAPSNHYEYITPNLIQKANKGDSSSQFELSTMHYFGITVKKDDHKAFKWCLLSASPRSELASTQNINKSYNNKAEHRLGTFYQHGIGVKKNLESAIKWYKIAASHGNKNSKEALEHLLPLQKKPD